MLSHVQLEVGDASRVPLVEGHRRRAERMSGLMHDAFGGLRDDRPDPQREHRPGVTRRRTGVDRFGSGIKGCLGSMQRHIHHPDVQRG
jgi:hypothetical protein